MAGSEFWSDQLDSTIWISYLWACIYRRIMDVFRKFLWRLISNGGYFFHFRVLILCNSKLLKFNRNKKIAKGHSSASLLFSYLLFFKFMDLLDPFALHKNISHCDSYSVIFYGCRIKLFSHKLAHVSRSPIWENLVHKFSSLNSFHGRVL